MLTAQSTTIRKRFKYIYDYYETIKQRETSTACTLPYRTHRAVINAGITLDAFRIPYGISCTDRLHDRHFHRADPRADTAADAGRLSGTSADPAEARRRLHDQRNRAEDLTKGALVLKPECQRDRQQVVERIAGKHPDHLMFTEILLPHIKSKSQDQQDRQADGKGQGEIA